MCPDIDECIEGTAGCAQMCTNVNSSYSCSCGSGYLLAIDEHGCEGTSDKFHCMYQYQYVDNTLDINECVDESLNFCEQLCNNTNTSHNCLCFDGYELNNDTFSCSGL